ncbi:MAG: HAMP domain-containing histidine kinase [SAR324 cluster bacterium]|uniref:histidine kinase n=1 Tax=SAR324 cluster bacterium TaxID=2024889 RepID=A0A7X9IKL2_9DELT|nr:HAMP domain-containing histidine kinase [SAR324 cluster bacterium]
MMEGVEVDIAIKNGRVLIFSTNDSDISQIAEVINERMPGTQFLKAKNIDDYQALLNNDEIDVAIVDYRLVAPKVIELVQSAKVKEYSPSLVLIESEANPGFISELYEAGVEKCFMEHENYRAEIAHVVRGIMWIRKLQEENTRLIARLTEANILLEEKNRRLDEFSATVAHDIRGPLGGVVMKLDFLLDRYRNEISEQFASVLQRALSSSQRLTEIVQAMYEFAKLGSKAATMGPVVIGPLIEEVIKDMNFDEMHDINFIIGDLPTIWGNDQLLRRVFINLIGNAVKYNDKAETVINIQCTGFVKRSIARFAEIIIQDNGPGIEQDELKDVFRFFGRGSAGRRDSDGLGVGLTVVQRIIELHFGSIRVESQIGHGTTFTLSLPTEKIDFIK